MLPVLVPLMAVPLLVGMWALVTTVLTQLTRWPQLAEAFPGGAVPPGPRLRVVLGFGPVRENNVTTLVPTADGLYFKALWFFRLRRRPILLPWNQIHYVRSRQFLWARWHTLDLAGITTMNVRHSFIAVLREYGVQVPADVAL